MYISTLIIYHDTSICHPMGTQDSKDFMATPWTIGTLIGNQENCGFPCGITFLCTQRNKTDSVRMRWKYSQKSIPREFQDPKMEALKHIKPDFKARFCGDIPLHSSCLGRIYVYLPPKKNGSWNCHWSIFWPNQKPYSQSPRFVCGVGRCNLWPHLFVKFLLLRLQSGTVGIGVFVQIQKSEIGFLI